MSIFDMKEIKYDLIFSVIISCIFLYIINIFKLFFIFENISQSIEIVITISATFTGFLITALSILFVFPEHEKIKFIEHHQNYKFIFGAFILSISLFIVVLLLCFIYIVMAPYIPSYILSVLIFLLVWAMVSLYRCIWLIKKMTEILYNKNQ